jgi:hypothetical protein
MARAKMGGKKSNNTFEHCKKNSIFAVFEKPLARTMRDVNWILSSFKENINKKNTNIL